MTDKRSEQDMKEDEVKVTDKRRFAEGGAVHEAAGDEPETVEAGEERPNSTEEAQAVPDIDFPTFVLSLATSAQVHLGAIPNPATGKQDGNSALAKQTIDILGILEEKTKGNLSEQEKTLMEHLLYDLRMMYLQLEKKGK